MKKIACFFNGPYLGGAERSFILQVGLLSQRSKAEFDFIVPYLNDKAECQGIVQNLTEHGFQRDKIAFFPFDPKLFSVSRGQRLWRLLSTVLGLLTTVWGLKRYRLKEHSHWWVNGNKIGFIVFLYGFFFRYPGQLLWHFRDYPAKQGLWKYVWKILLIPLPFRLKIIANSYDVAEELKKVGFKNVSVFYNPVAPVTNPPTPRPAHKNITLGVVAMLAPWKGIHDIVLFTSFYEKELRSLGVQKVCLYGSALYKTAGEHSGYDKQLEELVRKTKNTLIEFQGNQPPQKIFSHIDVLIHASLRKEPFGRVIMEGFSTGIPVISTGLGGAGELINHGVDGFLYDRLDPLSLLNAIAGALSPAGEKIAMEAFKSYQNMKEKIDAQMESIFP